MHLGERIKLQFMDYLRKNFNFLYTGRGVMDSISHCHCEGWSSSLPFGAISCVRA